MKVWVKIFILKSIRLPPDSQLRSHYPSKPTKTSEPDKLLAQSCFDGDNVFKKSDLKLSDLLEAFDGVLEMNGRMLIITTNHLEKLDPALVRPGRVDTSLEFKRCNKMAIVDFFKHFFKG